jgi:hypothetical protein
MSDTFTETTTKSWGSRIVGSITGVLFGIVLILGSALVLFLNEGHAIQTERSLIEGGKVVIDAAPDQIDAANEGKLIHVSGLSNATAPLVDPEFDTSTKALRMARIAEMYQWDEEKHEETTRSTGGSETTTTTYSYSKTWSDRTINSQNFRRRENHENPPKKYSRIDVNATDAMLGAFKLDERVLNLLSPRAAVPVNPQAVDKLKARIANAKVIDGKIYIGADPDKPQIGDYRISYLMVPVGPLSVIGQQAGSGFAQYQAKAGSRLLMAEPGTQSAAAMFKEAEDENRLITWLVRLAGMVAMWLGAVLILRPLVVVADVVPFIGSILGAGAALVALAFTVLVGPVVIAVAWLWYRPLVSVVVLAIGVAAGVGLHRLAARRHLARAAQPPAAPPPTPAAA